MGRSLGYHDSEELDRPELNKCPDCECLFATDACPLCGKICPEEMRAGNRAKVKKPKKQGRNSSGRVQFIEWYHAWWFILLMMYLMPIAGIILFFTSPHSKKSKIIAAASVVAVYVLMVLGWGWVQSLVNKPPVNDKISREEYVEMCDPMSAEEYYRDAFNEGNYVALELTVVDLAIDQDEITHYLCSDRNNGGVRIILTDYSVEKKTNYIPGDIIRVYGECSGTTVSWFKEENIPCLYMAYSELIG